ncbi:MAG: hypothetical protein L7U83_03575 [Akkermansiaceae bacterium]|nr:hypothetical protein [Akkermansiaceae bacterium]
MKTSVNLNDSPFFNSNMVTTMERKTLITTRRTLTCGSGNHHGIPKKWWAV